MDCETVLNDPKIRRVCGDHDLRCAIQLWILQHKKPEGEIESRILYGRVLPYCFCNSTWSAPKNDSFKSFNGSYAQLIRINLYTQSNIARKILVALGEGNTLHEISDNLSLSWDHSGDVKRFGQTKIQDQTVWRSPVYLPMRQDFYASGLQSVHSGAGCFSASLIQLEKHKLIEINDCISRPLIEYCIESLNTDTGLDFAEKDLERIGEIEIIAFSQLDERERSLFSIQWSEDRSSVIFQCGEGFHSRDNDHLIQIVFLNGSLHIHVAAMEVKELKAKKSYNYRIPEHLIELVDGYQIEVFSRKQEGSDWNLLFRDSGYFIREINLGLNVNPLVGQVKSTWLDSYTKDASEDKKKIQAIKCEGNTMTSTIRYRESDPWIPANRDFSKIVRSFLPEKVKPSGALFLRSQHEAGTNGRLKFAEWFQKLLTKKGLAKIFIFDPYFDTAGIGLIAQAHSKSCKYVVFTTQSEANEEESEEETPSATTRTDRIVMNCS